MTLPPLLLGTCQIGKRRYPAVVGKVKGRRREIFVCGVHIDRFIRRFSLRELEGVGRVRIDVGGREL